MLQCSIIIINNNEEKYNNNVGLKTLLGATLCEIDGNSAQLRRRRRAISTPKAAFKQGRPNKRRYRCRACFTTEKESRAGFAVHDDGV